MLSTPIRAYEAYSCVILASYIPIGGFCFVSTVDAGVFTLCSVFMDGFLIFSHGMVESRNIVQF